jgi:hypothetical protein
MRVFVLDASTFALLHTVDLPGEVRRIVVGENGRLYGAGGSQATGSTLYEYDGTTGEVLRTLDGLLTYPSHVDGIAPDLRTVYVINRNVSYESDVLYAFDVAGEPLVRIASRLLPRSSVVYSEHEVGPEGLVYVASARDEIEFLDGRTLDPVLRIILGLAYPSSVIGFRAAPGRLFVSLFVDGGNGDDRYRVIEYALDEPYPVRSWDFISDFGALGTTGRHHLYAGSWAVPL